MPDSYGKRQRNAKKARKLAEREERRLARKQQRADPEGVLPDGAPGESREEAPNGEAVEGSEEVAGTEAGPDPQPGPRPEDGA
jgi:hypothetical protein